jgi:hypothetical protein
LTNKKTKTERKNMNTKFDELTKAMAQSVTRRAALKKFGVGLAGMALACFGLAGAAKAGNIKPPARPALYKQHPVLQRHLLRRYLWPRPRLPL